MSPESVFVTIEKQSGEKLYIKGTQASMRIEQLGFGIPDPQSRITLVIYTRLVIAFEPKGA